MFEVYKIVCSEGCRNGLTARNEICSHLTDVEKLAGELMNYESNQKVPSELFRQIELYVDDPQFWSACLEFDQKLQRHKPAWVQQTFKLTAKKQLTQLSYRPMKKKSQQVLFKTRSEELLQLDANSHDEIRYLLEKQLQFMK